MLTPTIRMYKLPENIKDYIILDSILLKKNDNGWKNIHIQLLKSKTFLKKTHYVFDSNFVFERIRRMPCVSLIDIFSMDENGNYLDDACDEIIYW